MFRKLTRIVLTLIGILFLIFGVLFIGPTSAKDTFMKQVMNPKAEKLHKDLSLAMKLDDDASAALKKAILVMITQSGIAIIISVGISSTAMGISLIALSASLKRIPCTNPEIQKPS